MGIVHKDLVDFIRLKIGQHDSEMAEKLELFWEVVCDNQKKIAEFQDVSTLLDAEVQMRKEDKLRHEAEMMELQDEMRNPRS